jgi:hypothetical protein
MKNSNGIIGNRSRDLPGYSAVPQPLRHPVPNFKHTLGYENNWQCTGGQCSITTMSTVFDPNQYDQLVSVFTPILILWIR